MIFSLKLLILGWQGFYQKINLILAQDLQEHWDTLHQNMQYMIVGDNMQGAVFGELLDCLLKPTNIKEKISSLMLLASLGSECEETMLKQLMLLEFGKRTMLLKLKRPLKLLKELDSKFRKVLRIDVILVV
ncbi:uncharacterized protein LOC123888315 isoform X3 [Trifolium pratense]|uniref:uncharacterized protein LOC123888315 isoform X3 n=1 Tax=Trifolium pratense TaxID=57577 RepID=UPI001E696A2D|nr:uncharacterized protein LOC123888315 isoform X3 [Trifolium pratense]XP_045793282.1 uncharacterized protein LOC123888315 isoform X3 [Trifolium pratense]XP_045793283.1 uncharacterized protein LOC123888315 isoform X3 [Trifolium pratense]